MKYIENMMDKFSKKHKEHLLTYGEENFKRLTGLHETSSMDNFSYGVGNRAASFRIPSQTAADNGKGYIEDRRPGSNIDPYIVCGMICDTSLIPESESLAPQMLTHFKDWMNEGRKSKI
jgi:glutamine synthetase